MTSLRAVFSCLLMLVSAPFAAQAQGVMPVPQAAPPAAPVQRPQAAPFNPLTIVRPPASSAASATPAAAPVTAGEAYRLGTDDEIEISIFSTQNQVVRTRVKEDGTVVAPFIGAIQAKGLTARELAAHIADRLLTGGFLINPIVNVDVTQFVSNTFTVLGNVGTPGIFPIDRALTVSMAIARAGGARGDGADYAMLRRRSEEAQHRVDFGSIDGQWNGATTIQAGDTLFVPPTPIYFAYGQVNSPGAFPIRTGMTIRQALARAGGPTLAGTQNSVTLYRGDKKIKKANLDELIQADDTLYVNERLF